MSPTNSLGHGLAVVCNFDGSIAEVICDDFGVKDKLLTASHFVCLFAQASVQKGLAFFLEVKEHGAAFDWEIDVDIDSVPTALCFSAASLGDRLLITASLAWQGHNKIYEGLSRVINKQVNNLRMLSKASQGANANKKPDTQVDQQINIGMITDMLALNNRLVNAERQLARKNAELRRMSSVMSKDLHLAHRILHFSGEAVMVADRDCRVVDVNSAFTSITGYSNSEAVGKELQLIEPGYDKDDITPDIWQALANQGIWQGECTGRRKNGETFPKWLSISVVPDETGDVCNYVVNFSDISRLKYAEEQWQRLAFYDSLTNLPNRTLFKDRLQQSIAQANRDQESLALLFIDLDDFKVVNDSLGHDAGDWLLAETAHRLEDCTRETDTIYRLGGDEFTVIVHGCPNDLDVMQLCDKIINTLATPFLIKNNPVHIGSSIGIARYPSDGMDPDSLTKNADTAMYAAKANGRNTSCFFSKSLGDKVTKYLNLRAQIALGLQRNEFLVYLQPEIDLISGQVVSMEALLRWQHPTRGLVSPDEFIPVAEESGLMVELGEFVLCESLRIVRRLRGLGWKDMRIAVNVSGRQMVVPQFANMIVNRLHEYGLSGDALIIEITESMILGNLDSVISVLRQLTDAGIETAIDDFGTGYSSLNHLRRLPVEFLKIDKSFVADADEALESKTIIRAILAMAKSLGIKTIAEGIERPAQAVLLEELGCQIGQGYLYAKPLAYDKFLEFISSNR